MILLSLSNALAGSSNNVVTSIVGAFRRLKHPIPSSTRLHHFVKPTVVRSVGHGRIPRRSLSHSVSVCHDCCTSHTIFRSPGGPNGGIPKQLIGIIFPNVHRRLLTLQTSKCFLTLTDYGPRCRYIPVYSRFRLDRLLSNVCNTSGSGSHLSGSRIVQCYFSGVNFSNSTSSGTIVVNSHCASVSNTRTYKLSTVKYH